MGRDRYLPTWFGAVHPTYRTPYRSIVFLVPVALVFAYYAPLDQVITFSILSGLLGYTFMAINVVMFRNKWPLGSIQRGYEHPLHPLPAIVLMKTSDADRPHTPNIALPLGPPGTAVDLIYGPLDEGWDLDAFDSTPVLIHDAPRPEEIVLWIGYATGPRVNARCKGPDQKEVDALIASFKS